MIHDMILKSVFRLSLFLFACLFVIGCSGGKVSVTGTVKFQDGTPLKQGSVVLESEELAGQGRIGQDGSFTIGMTRDGQGIQPGTYKVAIVDVQTGPGEYLIAEKYQSVTQSGITFEVKPSGLNQLDITVEAPGK